MSWQQQVALRFPPGISFLRPVFVGFVNHPPCPHPQDQAEVPQAGQAGVGRDVAAWIRDCGLGGLAQMLRGTAPLKPHIRQRTPGIGEWGKTVSLETPSLKGQDLCRVGIGCPGCPSHSPRSLRRMLG